MRSFPLSGRHVVVTGASRGIGRELAREASQRGARVTLVARPSDRLSDAAESAGGHALGADLCRRHDVERVMRDAAQSQGPVDVLINNAALMGTGAFASLNADRLHDTLAANLLAPAELCRAAAAAMIQRRTGVIVNVSSFAGEMALRNIGAYSTSKGALTHLTRILQRELRGTGVRALTVLLGAVDTELIHENDADPVAGPAAKRLSAIPADDPVVVADKILTAIESRRRRPVSIPAAAAPMIAVRGLPSRMADIVMVGLKRSYS